MPIPDSQFPAIFRNPLVTTRAWMVQLWVTERIGWCGAVLWHWHNRCFAFSHLEPIISTVPQWGTFHTLSNRGLSFFANIVLALGNLSVPPPHQQRKNIIALRLHSKRNGSLSLETTWCYSWFCVLRLKKMLVAWKMIKNKFSVVRKYRTTDSLMSLNSMILSNQSTFIGLQMSLIISPEITQSIMSVDWPYQIHLEGD